MKYMFDLLYNNSASDAVAPLSDYEISLYLTKAQEELIKNKIETLGNKYGVGAEESNKRDLDLGILVTIETYNPFNNIISTLNDSSVVFEYPTNNVMKILNTIVDVEDVDTHNKYKTQGVQLNYNEYERKMSKPYKYPLKNQSWLVHGNSLQTSNSVLVNIFECVSPYNTKPIKLTVRYIRRPIPIITDDLPVDYQNNQLIIEGRSVTTNCELDVIIHNEIVQRAVEIAKATYSYDDNGNVQMSNQTQLGQRSE